MRHCNNGQQKNSIYDAHLNNNEMSCRFVIDAKVKKNWHMRKCDELPYRFLLVAQ